MKKLIVIIVLFAATFMSCEPKDSVEPTTYQIKNTTNFGHPASSYNLYSVKVHHYKNDSIIKTDSIGDLHPGEISHKIKVKNVHKIKPSFQFIKGNYTRYYTSHCFVLLNGENRIIKLTLRGFVFE